MSNIDASFNTDLLQAAKFTISFPRLIETQFFTQSLTLPGISTVSKIQNTPMLDLPVPGDKIIYEDLVLNFLIDEELFTWTTISDWMTGTAFPHSFQEYQNLGKLSRYSGTVKHPQYADLEIASVSSASMSPKVKFRFIDAFPLSLSGINYDVRVGSDQIMTATATFKYKWYNIIRS